MRQLSFPVASLLSISIAHGIAPDIAHADEPVPAKRVAAATEELTAPISLAAEAEPPAPRFPREILARPMTYPAGLATAGFDVGAAPRALDRADVRVLAGVGLTDRIEVNFGHYAFSTDRPGHGSFDFGLGAHLGQLLGDKLDLGAKVQSGYGLDAHRLDPLYAGVIGQYTLTSKLALITPGNQLAFGLSADQPAVTLGLPIALGYQASRLVFFQLDTTLATFDLGEGTARCIFAHTTPVALTAFVNVHPAIDVFAGVTADLTPPDAPGGEDDASPAPQQLGDTLGMVVGARYYFGSR
ncbi:MAG TPA: hypothetical protein VFP84_03305 [Kofleriaceae bacterium]|nr:hypothetical protein [Kofleriaceae bacterium]